MGDLHLVKQTLDWSASDNVDDVLDRLEDLKEHAITQHSEVRGCVSVLADLIRLEDEFRSCHPSLRRN